MSTPKKIHFSTLGCSKNQVDTEVMARIALERGYTLTANPEDADVITVNTCAFLEASKQESVERILELAEHREKGKCQQLVVTGCLPSRHPDAMRETLPEVDHFLGTNDLHHLGSVLAPKPRPITLISKDEEATVPQDYLKDRFFDRSLFSRYLKIAEGCDRKCAFCIIPAIRGPQHSRTIESLVEEAEQLVAQGAKEINLIAQDLTAYGHDLSPAKRLEDLLEKLVEVRGLEWLRLHYAYPQRISPRMIELLASGGPLLPYLDMPLQHIAAPVLDRMNRGTRPDALRKLLGDLRTRVPNLALRTTFIVGFPGETESDFEELLGFMREMEFDHAGAFMFSREEGTSAAGLPGQIPTGVKKKRHERLMEEQRQISRRKNEKRVGQEMDAIVIGPSPESDLLWACRSWHQAEEVDGTTYLGAIEDDSNLSDSTLTRLSPGDLVRIRVTEGHDYDLAAGLLSIRN